MTFDFECLRCPMCGGELIYSEGTHDLCCTMNTSEASDAEASRNAGRELRAGKSKALHEPRAPYESADGSRRPGELQGGGGADGRTEEKPMSTYTLESGFAKEPQCELKDSGVADQAAEKSSVCFFAVSFTESAKNGTLWSIRTVHGGTNYFALMRLMDKIEKRQRRGEPLAANVPNLPRRVERSKECKLAFRYNIEVEDLYSIKYSSETVDMLAVYYGLSEPDIRHIQAAEIGEEHGG